MFGKIFRMLRNNIGLKKSILKSIEFAAASNSLANKFYIDNKYKIEEDIYNHCILAMEMDDYFYNHYTGKKYSKETTHALLLAWKVSLSQKENKTEKEVIYVYLTTITVLLETLKINGLDNLEYEEKRRYENVIDNISKYHDFILSIQNEYDKSFSMLKNFNTSVTKETLLIKFDEMIKFYDLAISPSDVKKIKFEIDFFISNLSSEMILEYTHDKETQQMLSPKIVLINYIYVLAKLDATIFKKLYLSFLSYLIAEVLMQNTNELSYYDFAYLGKAKELVKKYH